jgi:hypothetical protein
MPAPHFSSNDDCLFTAMALETYGGSFASCLGKALLQADLDNRRRLIEAFPEIMSNYGPGSIDFFNARRDYYGGDEPK